MRQHLKNLAYLAIPNDSIDSVFRGLSRCSKTVKFPGFALVLDKKGVLQGVVTDGDIRRAYDRNISFDEPVSKIMILEPISITDSTSANEIVGEVQHKIRVSGRFKSTYTRYVPVLDSSNRAISIVELSDFLEIEGGINKNVAIYGLGYVGLTLAVHLSNYGHKVFGIDINQELMRRLNRGDVHIYEPGLSEMLKINIKSGFLKFGPESAKALQDIYIIAVGTAVTSDGQPDLAPLNTVLAEVGRKLRKGDQVMLRSTVVVSTTRNLVIPTLEKLSKLRAGIDFFVSFAPERTAEGQAMSELRTLPQIVGGYTAKCLQESARFWSSVASTVVRTESLEAAELVKLANNSFRDLSFAFANELALISAKHNINAFSLIHAANEGYPRNPISMPSPGVGGYCLTKDPLLFSLSSVSTKHLPSLGISSRLINGAASDYPYSLVIRYLKQNKVTLKDSTILIIGLAFKGTPPTKDVRGSVAHDLYKKLSKKIGRIQIWDAAISSDELRELGYPATSDLNKSVMAADAILIMNNHQENKSIYKYLINLSNKLIFDGWNQLDSNEIEKLPGMTYATMGYTTRLK